MTRNPQKTSELMSAMGRAARTAARELGVTPGAKRDEALRAMANAIRNDATKILQANDADINGLSGEQSTAAYADRLKLTPARIEAISKGLEDVAARHDPLGRVLEETTRPNGLYIARVSVPIGVIGIIYESRPNVTADAGALCLKSGNAVILRGGSEALKTSREIHQSMTRALVSVGLDPNAIQLVPTSDREAVGHMLSGIDGAIDLIIPRGGKSLVKRVHDEARIAVLAHLDGVNHVYVDRSADPEMAVNITLNAKMRRVSVCGAAETLLIDAAAPETLRRRLVLELLQSGCAVRGDSAVQHIDPCVLPASEQDWSTEYLDAVMSVKLVDGIDAAINHINTYGSHHTDAIISNDDKTAERFLQLVDSAIVLRNASTQFADGAEFGLGAEIGIATGRLHARGPVGADQLTIYKYVVRGHGQTRP